MAGVVLRVSGLSKAFGALVVADDVSFEVEEGEILGIIGPNGAGKTTLFSLLAGVLPIDGGSIAFNDTDVSHAPAQVRARLGMARTYQVPRPFSHMTVFDNLKVAAIFGGGLEAVECPDWIDQILALTGMAASRGTLAGRLPLLQRKRLELARALATRPSIILIDEVGAGLTDMENNVLIELVREINLSGVTVIWIEHVMKTMLSATDRLLALAGGRVIAAGPPREVLDAPEVRRVYLGV